MATITSISVRPLWPLGPQMLLPTLRINVGIRFNWLLSRAVFNRPHPTSCTVSCFWCFLIAARHWKRNHGNET